MKISDETRALMAVQILAALTIANVKATPEEVFESSWSAVDRLIAAAPAGDTAQAPAPDMGASQLHTLCEKYARTFGAEPGLIYWMRTVSDCIAGDPAGDAAPAAPTAQTVEPTEEEWEKAFNTCPYRCDIGNLGYIRAVSAEAHRLAALRGKA